MKMKITAVLVFLINIALQLAYPALALLFVSVSFVGFLLYGIERSMARKLDPLNDAPNSFRVLLAAASPYLALTVLQPFGFSLGALSLLGSVYLNDEYQRRTIDSLRKHRSGGSVALLGIDGSGKSTHAAELEKWFRQRGYYCTRVPFHRYLFVDALSRGSRSKQSRGERWGGNPLRPCLSALDNLLLYALTSFGRGLEGRVVLYDRYIWSTYVKYQALGYPVRPIRWLYMLPRPKFAVVLDITVEKSLAVIDGRPDHIRYRGDVLGEERSEYERIARSRGIPVVDASRDKETVQSEIEDLLAAAFPRRVA